MTEDLTIMEEDIEKKDLETMRCKKMNFLNTFFMWIFFIATINYHIKPLTETPTSDLYLSVGELDLNKSKTSKRGEVKLNLTGE